MNRYKMGDTFKCQLLGGLGNQIFQNVILNWIQKKTNKKIILSKFDFSPLKNKFRNIKGIQSTYFYEWLNTKHLVNNEIMLTKIFVCKLKKFFPYKTKFITDDIFLLGLKNGKDFLLKELSDAKFLRSHCVFPQIPNYEEFEESWLDLDRKNY